MKLSKKVISMLLTIVMILGVCTVGFTVYAAKETFSYVDALTHKSDTTNKIYNHDYVVDTDVEEEGNFVCNTCGYKHGLGEHDYDDDGDGVCDACGYCISHKWYLASSISATCTESGSSLFICKNCEAEKEERTSSALGHNWSSDLNSQYIKFEWDSVNFQRCTATILCERDGCNESISYTVHSKSGVANNGITSEIKSQPTCDKAGEIVYTAIFTFTDITGNEWEGFTNNGNHTYSFSTTYTVNLNPLGHNYTILVNATQPNCEHGQIETYKCSRCDSQEDRENGNVPALGHNFVDYTYNNDATCTANGTETGTCSVCGTKNTREKAGTKLAHTPVEVPQVDPSCTEAGKTAGTECAVCHEVIKDIEPIAALGHYFKNYKTNNDATCMSDGTKTATCERCGEATDTVDDSGTMVTHAFSYYTSNGDATCTKDGTKTAYCDYGCNTKDTQPDEGSAGHKDENVDEVCDICGEHVHQCSVSGHMPDTSKVAYTEKCHSFKCSQCDTWIEFAHVWEVGYKGEGTAYHWISCRDCAYRKDLEPHMDEKLNYVDQEGNVTTDGLCDVCNGELEHRYKKSKDVAATCTTRGYIEYTCMNCVSPSPITEYTTAALGHNWGEPTFKWDTLNFTSCTAIFTCTRTGCSETIEYEVTADSGYAENKVALKSSTAPGCTTKGQYVYEATFTVLDQGNFGWHGNKENADGTFTFTSTYIVNVPYVGHDFSVLKETTVATCTDPQILKMKCSKCDATTEVTDSEHPALGHIDSDPITDKSVAPSCETAGYETRKCPRCEIEYTTPLPSYGGVHDFTDYVVVSDSETCTVDHIERRTCTRCNLVDELVIEKENSSHTWGEWDKTNEATCEEDGYWIRVCEKCNEEEKQIKEKTGHNITNYVTTNPTCYAEGTKVGKCSKCGNEVTQILPKTSHNFKETNYEVSKAPTCTVAGEEICKCSNEGCNETKTRVIPATGHNMKAVKVDSQKGKFVCANGCGTELEFISACTDNGKKCIDANFDTYCDNCLHKINVMSDLLHYVVGWPSYIMRFVVRFCTGGDWKVMREDRFNLFG